MDPLKMYFLLKMGIFQPAMWVDQVGISFYKKNMDGLRELIAIRAKFQPQMSHQIHLGFPEKKIPSSSPNVTPVDKYTQVLYTTDIPK